MKLMDFINEQSIGYTPEKIDQLVIEAGDYVNKFRKLFETTQTFVLDLTIRECISDMDNMRIKLKKLEEFKVSINAKYDKYYGIIDTFEVGEYPNNVKLFEQSVDEIDHLMQDFENLLDALKDIISNSDYISR